jgi:hypothetical protein
VLACIGGDGINMQFTGGHIEQPNGPVVSVASAGSNSYLSLSNMEIILTSSTGAERGYMEVEGGSTSADSPYINAVNVRLYEAHHVPIFLRATGRHVNFCHLGLMQQRVIGAFPTATGGSAAIGCDETIK